MKILGLIIFLGRMTFLINLENHPIDSDKSSNELY